jgi:hypothetical protein
VSLSGQRPALLSGFGLLRPVALAACGYAVAAVVWLALGDALPGGRWFAVHLFTVGILSNLVVALTEHFGRTLTKAGPPGQRLSRFAALNVGALLLLGSPPHLRYPFVAGSLLLVGTVLWLGLDLRRMRRSAPEARFGYVLAAYEHACAAFVVGAVLGALLGTQVLPGPWWGPTRLAHLHVNILGWGGLTLLATMAFLGPAMLRTQMAPGADRRARHALRLTPLGLGVAVTALLAKGPAGHAAAWPDLLAGAGLLLYAAGAALIAGPLLSAGRAAKPSTHAWMIQAAAAWFVVAVIADGVAIATGRLRLLDGLGAVLIAGVLGQAILAALNHLAPMVWGKGSGGRTAVRGDAERLGRVRALALNVGVAAVLAAAIAGRDTGLLGTVLARGGWTLVALVVLAQVGLVARSARPALAARRAGHHRGPDSAT